MADHLYGLRRSDSQNSLASVMGDRKYARLLPSLHPHPRCCARPPPVPHEPASVAARVVFPCGTRRAPEAHDLLNHRYNNAGGGGAVKLDIK